LGKFRADFIGLRGEGARLQAIEEAYGVYAQAEEHVDGEPYLVTHTARIFLIGPEGQLLTNYPFGTDPEEILSDLRYLIERSP
jgi:protein SCO1/2